MLLSCRSPRPRLTALHRAGLVPRDREKGVTVRRIFPFATICFLLLLAVAGPAQAGPYPPKGARVGVSDSTVTPGQTIVVSGSKWFPGSTVNVSFDDPVEKTAQVDGSGNFATSITIPTATRLGQHTITVTGLAANDVAATRTLVVNVLASGPGLAFTGANVTVWMVVIPVFAIVGLGLLLMSRRRRTHVGER
jgi:hypothetical protein